MKKLVLALAFAGLIGKANAQSSGFGLGIMIGDPTGLSGKLWLTGDRAVDFGLAWGVYGNYVHVHADYLFHNTSLLNVSKGQLALYYGPGLRLRSWSGGRYWNRGRWEEYDGSRLGVGVRFPVGLDYMFDGAPVDCFLEIVPSLDLTPSTSFDLDAAIGARYWF
jgi:Protein of unknown function (DUF3996)